MKKLLLFALLSTTAFAHAAQAPAEKCEPLTQKERISRAAQAFLVSGLAVTAGAYMIHNLLNGGPEMRACIFGIIGGLCTAYDKYQERKGCGCPNYSDGCQCKESAQTTTC